MRQNSLSWKRSNAGRRNSDVGNWALSSAGNGISEKRSQQRIPNFTHVLPMPRPDLKAIEPLDWITNPEGSSGYVNMQVWSDDLWGTIKRALPCASVLSHIRTLGNHGNGEEVGKRTHISWDFLATSPAEWLMGSDWIRKKKRNENFLTQFVSCKSKPTPSISFLIWSVFMLN